MRKSSQFQILGGICLLVLFSVAGTFAFAKASYGFCILMGGGVVYTAAKIWHGQQAGMRMFLRLLDELKYHDNTLHFPEENKVGLERELAEKMNAVLSDIKERSFSRVEQSNYYETLLNLIDSCLIVVDEKGHIYWMNEQAECQLCGHAVHCVDELSQVHAELPRLIRTLEPGKIRSLRIYHKEVVVDMAVTVTEYQRRGRHFQLVHLRNVRSLLEENEMEAWQKLVRVLTHEIMNSIAPIISLSDTLSEYSEDTAWTAENGALLSQGLQTIHRRSKGLLEFVENYRKLTRIASPVLAPVDVNHFLADIRQLCTAYPVTFETDDEDVAVMMDRTQMEQVLINLIKNAYEACREKEDPQIVVRSEYEVDQRLWTLSVKDNGCGILPDVVDKIFVPFFTTKPAGSGIGLSLCKQVVNLHGGRISVKSKVDAGSTFIIRLVG